MLLVATASNKTSTVSAANAGTAFFPAGTENGRLTDYRGRTELRFHARGDGRQYTVVFLGAVQGGIPPMYAFTAGPDWQEIRIPLADVMNLDLR